MPGRASTGIEPREEFDLELTTAGMKKEPQAKKDVGVHDEVKIDDSEDNYDQDALSTMWVKRPKGAETQYRLICRGRYQETTDKDDTYASTPLLIELRLLLLIGLTKNDSFNIYDVITAFLHAELKEEVYVKPPLEFYTNGGVLRKLQCAD